MTAMSLIPVVSALLGPVVGLGADASSNPSWIWRRTEYLEEPTSANRYAIEIQLLTGQMRLNA